MGKPIPHSLPHSENPAFMRVRGELGSVSHYFGLNSIPNSRKTRMNTHFWTNGEWVQGLWPSGAPH